MVFVGPLDGVGEAEWVEAAEDCTVSNCHSLLTMHWSPAVLLLLVSVLVVLAHADDDGQEKRDYRPLQFGKRDGFRPLQFGKRDGFRPLQFGKREGEFLKRQYRPLQFGKRSSLDALLF